mgnify:CR=1 FL=1
MNYPIPFSTKIQEFEPMLKNYALQLTRNIDDANDLLQETFLKAMMYSAKFKEGTNLKGWMYTIMRNTFINNYRRITKRNTFMDTQEEQYIIDTAVGFSTFNSGESNFMKNDIQNAIKKLPNDLRISFELNNEGFKYHEIAEKLDIPIGTVKTRIFVARRKLRKHLAEYEALYSLVAS